MKYDSRVCDQAARKQPLFKLRRKFVEMFAIRLTMEMGKFDVVKCAELYIYPNAPNK
jgi:hypothetical protein